MAFFRREAFFGSNSAHFVGQSLGDVYLSDPFLPPPVAFQHPPGCPVHIRLTAQVFMAGITHYFLELTYGGAGNPLAIWHHAPAWMQIGLDVADHGTPLVPINPPVLIPLLPILGAGGPGPFGIRLGYGVPWPRRMVISHTLRPPNNAFHYHRHHRRQRYQHIGMPLLRIVGILVHRRLRGILGGTQQQFFRKAQ